MNDGPGLSLTELRRQLTDLAESVDTAQAWDDPLPHVLRAASSAELEADPNPSAGRLKVIRNRLPKISRPHFNPVPLISVAAAFLVVALIGVLIHGGGGSDSKKSTVAAGTQSQAAAAGGHAGSGAASAVPGPSRFSGSAPRAAECETRLASSKVTLDAPGAVVRGQVIRVTVTTSGGLRLTSPTIVVRSGLDVVGRLVPTVLTPAPTTSGSESSFVVTGRLVRIFSSCGDLPGNTVPGPVSSLAAPLPAGHYELVVTGLTSAGRVAGAPVDITIHR